jgi:hypothetical protein
MTVLVINITADIPRTVHASHARRNHEQEKDKGEETGKHDERLKHRGETGNGNFCYTHILQTLIPLLPP